MHLRKGLHSERVRMSQVECEAVVQSYAECYLFLMTALELSAEEQRAWYEEAATMVRTTCAHVTNNNYCCWYIYFILSTLLLKIFARRLCENHSCLY